VALERTIVMVTTHLIASMVVPWISLRPPLVPVAAVTPRLTPMPMAHLTVSRNATTMLRNFSPEPVAVAHPRRIRTVMVHQTATMVAPPMPSKLDLVYVAVALLTLIAIVMVFLTAMMSALPMH
jgi:hypothetical protein